MARRFWIGYCDSWVFKLFRRLDDVAYPARYQRVVARIDYWLISRAADFERRRARGAC